MPNRILFMPNCSNIQLISAPIEMSNEGFDLTNIAEAVVTYILTCVPNSSISIIVDILSERNNAIKYGNNPDMIEYLRGVVKEKII